MNTNDLWVFLKLYNVEIIGNVLSSPSLMNESVHSDLKRSVNLLQLNLFSQTL